MPPATPFAPAKSHVLKAERRREFIRTDAPSRGSCSCRAQWRCPPRPPLKHMAHRCISVHRCNSLSLFSASRLTPSPSLYRPSVTSELSIKRLSLSPALPPPCSAFSQLAPHIEQSSKGAVAFMCAVAVTAHIGTHRDSSGA